VFHLTVGRVLAWPLALASVLQGFPLAVAMALAAAAMATASLVLVRRIAPEAAGSGVHEVEGAIEGIRGIRWQRVLPVKFFGGILSLSSGLVLGREGPTIHIGAAVAEFFAEWVRLGDLDRKGLLAAGAAGGLAAAFNAPVAAVLFVLEETRRQFPYTFRAYVGVIIASCMSALVTESLTGTSADLAMDPLKVPLWLIPAFVALGGVVGALGVVLNAALLGSLRHMDRWRPVGAYAFVIVVGLVMGVFLLYLPMATRGGDELVVRLIDAHHTLGFLTVLLMVRFLTTVGSYVSGVPGGIFAPILSLGTVAGLAFGTGLAALLPPVPDLPGACAVAAMAALFTGSVRAPLVGTVLVLEMTGTYELTLPVLLACGTAHWVAQYLGGQPLYEELLERTLRRSGQPAPAHDEEAMGLAAGGPVSKHLS
jgi:CIC family chloride channel protein